MPNDNIIKAIIVGSVKKTVQTGDSISLGDTLESFGIADVNKSSEFKGNVLSACHTILEREFPSSERGTLDAIMTGLNDELNIRPEMQLIDVCDATLNIVGSLGGLSEFGLIQAFEGEQTLVENTSIAGDSTKSRDPDE